jgi:dGTPase
MKHQDEFRSAKQLLLEENLAPYASKSKFAHRQYPEPLDVNRPAFKIDCHRIRNCNTSLRLRGKTQVLPAGIGDHYRTRASHTDSVVTAARDIAERLGLNSYLAEAIALAHDLGHTPFGHAGEDALNDCMKKFGKSFEHNEQSLRAVTVLEGGYPNFRGLNLTIEVLDGLKKHMTPWDNPGCKTISYPTLEAQVVNMADQIAYIYHDSLDGLRRGVFDLRKISEIPLFARVISRAKEKYGENLESDVLISRSLSALHGILVEDLVSQTQKNLSGANIKSLEDVYKHSKPLVTFSDVIAGEVGELNDFLHDVFYKSDEVRALNIHGKKIIKSLFDYYLAHFDEVPKKFREIAENDKPTSIKDFIAGMTDFYAENEANHRR